MKRREEQMMTGILNGLLISFLIWMVLVLIFR